jgi:sugar phosphate isomerase/epimerase
MSSRRDFFRTSVLTASTAGLYSPWATLAKPNLQNPASSGLATGIAGYTFHNVALDQCISMMKQVNINALSIKDFYIPLNSSQDKINEVLAKFSSAGITVYAAGVIYMKTNAEVDQAFDYAGKLGIKLIIGVPNYELLAYVEEKVKSTNIRLAIHNHGPEDKLYPGPREVYEKIKDMNPGIGVCLDIGHALRAGQDPVKAVTTYGVRLFDVHVKDLAKNTAEETSVPLGNGIIDIPALVKALNQIRFTGRCSLEYEVNEKDILPGLAESVGYFRGVNKALA